MMNLLLPLISKILKTRVVICLIILALFIFPAEYSSARIYLNINAPSVQAINIAIPDFKNVSDNMERPELAGSLPAVLSNDLDLSGYFTVLDKESFLETEDEGLGQVRFRNWSVIGAELLLKAEYTIIGRSIEVEARLYDVSLGRRLFSRRFLGKTDKFRDVMHRIGNEIIYLLSGREGMFLTKLLFVGTATGYKEIYSADFDGHNVKQLTSDRSIALFPKWSPKGDKYTFNSYREGDPRLFFKETGSKAVKRLSSRKGLNLGASWFPDGKSLALTLSHKGSPDIYSIDLKGKIIKRLTNHWAIDVSPAVSPDGKKMAFVSDRSGVPQIWVMDFEKGVEKRLTFEGKYNSSPSWSSQNRIVYAGMHDSGMDIYTIDPDGRNLMQLTENSRKNEDPAWSPDGRYIAFSSNREGRYRIYIMNAYGWNQRRITAFKGEQTAPSWSIK